MKLLHFSDSRGNNSNVARALGFAKGEGISLVIGTGNFLGATLSLSEGKELLDTAQTISQHVHYGGQVALQDKVNRALNDPEAPQALQLAARTFKSYEEMFDERSKKDYTELSDMFSAFPGTVLVVPGNWDSIHFNRYFPNHNTHLKSGTIEDVKFAGYGGAPRPPLFLPPTRIAPYNPPMDASLFEFLSGADPNIALTNIPPYKVLDGSSQRKNNEMPQGSMGLRAYISEQMPQLVLCGHSGEPGTATMGGSIKSYVLNSGNLGSHDGRGTATFSVVEFEKDGEKDIALTSEPQFYIIKNDQISKAE